jgi:tRNA threonylcarbamoyl adenosine modification protein YeaZ
MNIFAIELSSRYGSLAVIENGRVVAEESWQENFKNRQQLFDAMDALKTDWDRMDGFVVGRGPGAFSGMRIAFSVANALAAPAGRPVHALNSAAALAAEGGAEQTVVVGDARRERVWAGLFSGSELEGEFKLLEHDALAGFVPPGARVISPDHDRLEELLAGFENASEPQPAYPAAGALGLLAAQRLAKGEAFEPLEPLYMHPPVFIKPRFPS